MGDLPPERVTSQESSNIITPSSTEPKKQLNNNNHVVENIRSKERMNSITEQLVGKEFQTPANISILYPDKEMKKSPMILDTAKQTITCNDQTIQLSLPMGASINKVKFEPKEIIVEGKVGIFSKEGSVSYEAFMNGIDYVLKNGKTSIASAAGEIGMKIV